MDNVFYHTALHLGQRMLCTSEPPHSQSRTASTNYGTLSLSGDSYRTVGSDLLRLQPGSCCY